MRVELAFEFLVLTAARWGEVRGAVWAEIDRKEGVWTVPATHMKAKREHRVPLCHRAPQFLDEARTLGSTTTRSLRRSPSGVYQRPVADFTPNASISDRVRQG